MSEARIHIDKKGIQYKTWKAFLLFAIFIIALLWLMQVFLVNVFFRQMQARQLISVAHELSESYETEGNSGRFRDSVQSKIGLVVYVFDSNGRIVYNNTPYNAIGTDRDTNSANILSFINQVDKEYESGVKMYRGEHYFLGTAVDSDDEVIAFVYGEKVVRNGMNYYVYTSTPSSTNDATVRVLAIQLLIVSAAIIAASIVMSLWFANALSSPIVGLTKAAIRFGKGDRNIVFDGGGYSEMDALATELNNSNRELIKTDELRRDLVANVSHDLKTPLTLIRGNAEMIIDLTGDNKEKRDKQLSVIVDEVDRLTLLVNDMLKLSQLQAGVIDYNVARLDFSELVGNAVRSFGVLEATKGYDFIVDIDDGLFVDGDAPKLEQVVYNLLSNAISYCGEDKQVLISLKRSDNFVRFSVTDHGNGMSEEDIKSIWTKYYRAERVKRETVGTGLGLNIVYNVLKKANAKFGVDSVLGEGSTFWFELNLINTEV